MSEDVFDKSDLQIINKFLSDCAVTLGTPDGDAEAMADEIVYLVELKDKYKKIKDENAALREALEFYANEDNYWRITDGGKCHEMTNADQGNLARQALKIGGVE